MKLTKGKISKLYSKKRQSLKKNKYKNYISKENKTFRKKHNINLSRKSLKRINKKYIGGEPLLPNILGMPSFYNTTKILSDAEQLKNQSAMEQHDEIMPELLEIKTQNPSETPNLSETPNPLEADTILNKSRENNDDTNEDNDDLELVDITKSKLEQQYDDDSEFFDANSEIQNGYESIEGAAESLAKFGGKKQKSSKFKLIKKSKSKPSDI